MNNKLYLILLFVFAAWGVCHLFAFVSGVLDPCSLQFLGQYGDFFGCLNTLFSGLAMVGAVYAVLLQRESLDDLQKQSLRERQHQEELLRLGKLEEAATGLMSWTNDMTQVVLSVSNSIQSKTSFDRMNWFRLHHSRELVQTIVEIHFPDMSSDLKEIKTGPLIQAIQNALRETSTQNDDVERMWNIAFEVMDKIKAFRTTLLEKRTDLLDAAKRPSAPSLSSVTPGQ